MKYKVIKNKKQYENYCDELKSLITDNKNTDTNLEAIELLTLLISVWENENSSYIDYDPIKLLKSLEREHGLLRKELAEIAGVSVSHMSDVMNYRKSLSKNVVRRLSKYFKIQQSALNRHYKLISDQSFYEESYNPIYSNSGAYVGLKTYEAQGLKLLVESKKSTTNKVCYN